MNDLISRQEAIDALGEEPEVWIDDDEYAKGMNVQWQYDRIAIEALPSVEPVKVYTKANYIMALHKEYGCTLIMAEEAHNKALEYLRSKARMKG